MATRTIPLSQGIPVNLAADDGEIAAGLGTAPLVADTTYSIQVIGANRIHIAEAASFPAVAGHIIEPLETWSVTVLGAAPPWVWSPLGDTRISITEA